MCARNNFETIFFSGVKNRRPTASVLLVGVELRFELAFLG